MRKIVIILLMIAIVVVVGFLIYSNSKEDIYSDWSCKMAGGEIINTIDAPKGNFGCGNSTYLGDVEGLKCPCVCCKTK